MEKYVIRYTAESWRTVDVEADSPEQALSNFQNEINVLWSTSREFDTHVDYENAEVANARY